MKKFFIIFAIVGVALLLPSKVDAQTKAFKDAYKKIVTGSSNDTDGWFKYIEVTYFEGNVLRSLTPKDRQDENNSLVKRIEGIYQIKLNNYKTNDASTYWYYEMRKVINGGCYTLISRSKIGDDTYEIYKESQNKETSEYLVVIALIILMLAALRASAYKSTSMGLLGSSVVVNAFAVALLLVGDLYDLGFFKDISLALIFFGFVGTIAFAVVLGGDDG